MRWSFLNGLSSFGVHNQNMMATSVMYYRERPNTFKCDYCNYKRNSQQSTPI